MDNDYLMVPPHSLEAEQSLLGSLMLGRSGYDDVADMLSEDDFYQRQHRILYAAVKRLSKRHTEPDVITVGDALAAAGELEDAGGMEYVNSLAESAVTTSSMVAYAQIVADHAALRRLIKAGREIAEIGFNPGTAAVTEILSDAERMVLGVADRGGKSKTLDLNAMIDEAVKGIDERFHSTEPYSGLTTGLTEFDNMTNGLAPGDLMILAGRPAMGKSLMMQTISENTSVHNDKVTVIFSLEMPGDQLVNRSLSSLGRIDMNRIKSGKLHEDDFPKLAKAIHFLKDRKLIIDDSSGISPQYMRSALRRIQREHGKIDLIALDYLQLMKIPGFKEGRVGEISEISRNLKMIAKEFGCPMVALSQLNRSLEQRPNKRPVNSDLRESGAIEQDADIIVFIYRDEVYNEDSPDKGIAELIIGKQRSGPVGTVRVAFNGRHQRFDNLAFSYQREYGDE